MSKFNPAVRISRENDQMVELVMDLPGVQASDLQVQIEDNILNISGKRLMSRNKVLTFSRLFQLDTTSIDTQKMTANLIDGVLTIAAYKSEKLTTPINIALLQIQVLNILKNVL